MSGKADRGFNVKLKVTFLNGDPDKVFDADLWVEDGMWIHFRKSSPAGGGPVAAIRKERVRMIECVED